MRSKYIRDGRAPIPANEITSKVMSTIKDRNTKPELLLRKALWQSGIKGYRLHWNQTPGKPNIAFPVRKLSMYRILLLLMISQCFISLI